MVSPSSSKRRRRPAVTRTRGGGARRRSAVAAALVVLALVVVTYLAWRVRRPAQAPAVADAGEVVRAVAARLGCGLERVTAETSMERGASLSLVTVHAPRGFQTERFVLDLEARAHNLGGRLEPRPLMEKGGYGLARLEGDVGGSHWRILVLGEEPPPAGKRAEMEARQRASGARLAIVLDDAGASMEVVRETEELPTAVAVAVLPNALRSAEVARGLGAQGREVLLHMPMEPLGTQGPGPGEGAVEVGLPAHEIRVRVERALGVVAGARGMNNHMGSRATADAAAMRAVMSVLRERGLYFLDSRTTPDSVAEQVARENGIPALRRDVFLDVVSEPEAIRHALEQAVARARAQGSAVAIGHVHPLTIEILAHELPKLGPDVRLVRPSQLLR
ncbi:MAG: divergent polysaccharide deacetylase family protein [Thermoanaerobaculaceae bacterium]